MNESGTAPETLSPEDMPGLDRAYDFVQPSYQWALARYEAGNTRLQTMLTVVASVSLAVPTLAKLLDDSLLFADKWFALACVAFLAAMAIGVYGRHAGTVVLADPRVLLRGWLSLPEAQFKYDALYWASDHFAHNVGAVERKWRCAGAMLALFLVEAGLLLAWTFAS